MPTKPPMRHTLIRRVAAAIVAVASLSALAQSSPHATLTVPQRNAALDAVKVPFDDALIHAQDNVVNGLAYRIEVTTRDDKPVHLLHMLVGDPTHVMTLDAATGAVVEQHDESFNKYGTVIRIRLAEPNVGLGQAIQLAEAESPGFRAYSCEAVVKGNQIFFEVRLVSKEETRIVTLSQIGKVTNAGPPPAPIKKK